MVSPATPTSNYAESVMIGAISDDGAEEVSLRLARFPESGIAHIWLHLSLEGQTWSLVDEQFELESDVATPIHEDQVTFSAKKNNQRVLFIASARNSGWLKGHVDANLLVNSTRYPEVGPGEIPVRMRLDFDTSSPGFNRDGRWEVAGQVEGEVVVAEKRFRVQSMGKWHEQTGPRRRFAPAFTYLNLQGEFVSLLAIGFRSGAVGYVIGNGGISQVIDFEIDPVGRAIRHFRVKLQDGKTVEGNAKIVQRWSVPIEGKTRPGSTVIVESNQGRLVGSLNDWAPDD